MSVLSKILHYNADRDPVLLKIKLARMSVSPFTFFRGANHLFADTWLKLSPPEPGPPILICGDLHIENFGAFRTEQGDWCFGINDFDDSLIAPCGLDVVRCAASIFLAAVDWKLSPVSAASLVLTFLDEYRETIEKGLSSKHHKQVEGSGGKDLISRALGSDRRESKSQMIAAITNAKRTKIRRDKQRRPALSKRLSATMMSDLQDYLEHTDSLNSFQVLDVTGRIAGIGSVGYERYLALIADHQSPTRERILDIKLAVKSSISEFRQLTQTQFSGNEAERVVVAQRQLQGESAVGLNFTTFQNKSFRIREMVPDEDRCQIDRFRKKISKLKDALKIIGRVVAWSHLRGAEFGSLRQQSALQSWSSGANLDAVLKSAVRYAERTTEEYRDFKSESRSSKRR